MTPTSPSHPNHLDQIKFSLIPALTLTPILVPTITPSSSSRLLATPTPCTQAGALLLATLNVMGYYTRFAAGEWVRWLLVSFPEAERQWRLSRGCMCARCEVGGGAGQPQTILSCRSVVARLAPLAAEMIGPFNKARGISLVMVGSAVTGSFGPQVSDCVVPSIDTTGKFLEVLPYVVDIHYIVCT